MALLHQATLSPSKLELLGAWLPSRRWCDSLVGTERPEQLGAYRLDDPAGEVGIESFLLRVGDATVLHVPLTYRAAPLAGAEQHLVGEMEHSVLGHRWVYDGCGDPVWATTTARTVLTGGVQADLTIEIDGEVQHREPTATVRGTRSEERRVGKECRL